MSIEFIELLWKWIVLVEKRLAEALSNAPARTVEDVERELAVVEIRGALLALGLTVPTVDELRERWADDERRGRERVHGDAPITEVEE